MKSTDHSLNNPTKVEEIELMRTYESQKFPNVVQLPEDAYRHLDVKDPFTIYVTEREDQYYYGEQIVHVNKCNKRMYLIGSPTKEGLYPLYCNIKFQLDDRLILIALYKTAQQAINAMNLYNNTGSHQMMELKIRNVLINYLKGLSNVHTLIMGILIVFGYGEDARFQDLIRTMTQFQVDHSNDDVPVALREELPYLRQSFPNSLFPYYADLYDVIVKNNFFKDKRYREDPDNADVASVIRDIFEVIQ